MPKTPCWGPDRTIFRVFRTLHCNFSGNTFRKNGPPMAPPAKVLHPKWPQMDYLILTVSSKSGKNIEFSQSNLTFFRKNSFSILCRLRPVSSWQCVLPQGPWDPRIVQTGKMYIVQTGKMCIVQTGKMCIVQTGKMLSLIHIWRCRRSTLCRSRWSPYH